MSQQAIALTKAGWTHVRTVKRGMVTQVWWREPHRKDCGPRQIVPQSYAYAWHSQNRRNKVNPYVLAPVPTTGGQPDGILS